MMMANMDDSLERRRGSLRKAGRLLTSATSIGYPNTAVGRLRIGASAGKGTAKLPQHMLAHCHTPINWVVRSLTVPNESAHRRQWRRLLARMYAAQVPSQGCWLDCLRGVCVRQGSLNSGELHKLMANQTL